MLTSVSQGVLISTIWGSQNLHPTSFLCLPGVFHPKKSKINRR
jgi:hypothetical protein